MVDGREHRVDLQAGRAVGAPLVEGQVAVHYVNDELADLLGEERRLGVALAHVDPQVAHQLAVALPMPGAAVAGVGVARVIAGHGAGSGKAVEVDAAHAVLEDELAGGLAHLRLPLLGRRVHECVDVPVDVPRVDSPLLVLERRRQAVLPEPRLGIRIPDDAVDVRQRTDAEVLGVADAAQQVRVGRQVLRVVVVEGADVVAVVVRRHGHLQPLPVGRPLGQHLGGLMVELGPEGHVPEPGRHPPRELVAPCLGYLARPRVRRAPGAPVLLLGPVQVESRRLVVVPREGPDRHLIGHPVLYIPHAFSHGPCVQLGELLDPP